MNQIIFNPPGWRWDDDSNAHDILHATRPTVSYVRDLNGFLVEICSPMIL